MEIVFVPWKCHRMVMNSHNLSCPWNQFSWPKAVRHGYYDERDLSIVTPIKGQKRVELMCSM